MTNFQRGDRVQHEQGNKYEPLCNVKGTVTHLPGDVGFDSIPGFVWVAFDNGEEAWVVPEMLIHISE